MAEAGLGVASAAAAPSTPYVVGRLLAVEGCDAIIVTVIIGLLAAALRAATLLARVESGIIYGKTPPNRRQTDVDICPVWGPNRANIDV